MKINSLLLAIAVSLLGALNLVADVQLAAPFTDHMVIQQGMRFPVWGKAGPNEEVVVSYAGQKVKARSSSSGNWRIFLEPLKATNEGSDLTVSGSASVATSHDVVVGEVWLCSGQSNMEWPVQENGVTVAGFVQEVANANYPLIRQLKIPKSNFKEPAETFRAEWTVCSPVTVGGYSGIAYFFARELFQKLDVPIGIINTSYGGTPIEAWLSKKTFESDPACVAARTRFADTVANWSQIMESFRKDSDAWKQEADAAQAAGTKTTKPQPRAPIGLGHPYSPITVYNAMVHPLIPYGIRGVLWYQGEANAGRASEYEGLLTALIGQWRQEWGQGEFPFYFVQLPNFKGDASGKPTWAWLREAQAKTWRAVPNTGMAVTIDIGSPDTIHPRNKRDFGHRIALLVLASTYGQDVGEFLGPTLVRSERANGAIKLLFEHASGLNLKSQAGFEIAGADRKFVPATAVVHGMELFVSSPEVKEPIAVRYAWLNSPEVSLFNGANLPAGPFRTDDWPQE